MYESSPTCHHGGLPATPPVHAVRAQAARRQGWSGSAGRHHDAVVVREGAWRARPAGRRGPGKALQAVTNTSAGTTPDGESRTCFNNVHAETSIRWLSNQLLLIAILNQPYYYLYLRQVMDMIKLLLKLRNRQKSDIDRNLDVDHRFQNLFPKYTRKKSYQIST